MSCSKTGIGLAGFGTVGSGVWKIIERNGGLINSRSQGAISIAIRKIAVRDLTKTRGADAPNDLFTTNLMDVVEDPSVDIVVELIRVLVVEPGRLGALHAALGSGQDGSRCGNPPTNKEPPDKDI